VSILIVHHFGPDPSAVGGMATVIRVTTEHNIGGESVCAYPTWRAASPITTAKLFAAAGQALLRVPETDVAHIHLSERGSFLREGSLVALARRRGLATVVTIHGASFIPFARKHPLLVSTILTRAHLIICLDDETLGIVRRSAPSVRSEIVPNAVFVDDEWSPADKTKELVVFAGEIGLRKGADVLHRAWQVVAHRRPRARCVMVGPLADFTPARAKRLEILPAKDPFEMRALLREARVVALPSRAEGMPMVLAEAMSVGRPFVSTPVGGIPGLAQAGGILVTVGDEIDLADRLTDLLADPDLARTLGERGRQFCLETRSVSVIDARLKELYLEIARSDVQTRRT
jgi:glycosyltransferase involved in cell wall biosynthesis